ncbi:unnamed protein product, partial [Ectocarpus sp. 8 AP-2014]
MRSCTTGSYHLLQRLAGGSSNHAPFNATAAASFSVMHGSRKRLSSSGTSSGTWDLYRKYADSPEDLVELMRRIVSRGGRGRKQDNVPKEVVKVFCGRYSQLDQAGKEDLLLSMARDFTPSRESVEAAVDRYAASVSPPAEPPAEPPASAAGAGAAADGVDEEGSNGDPRQPGVGGDSTESSGRLEGGRHVRAYERLREELSPAYEALLKNVVAESDDGVRFVVDLRQDLLEVMRRGRRRPGAGEGRAAGPDPLLSALDGSIRSLLQAWFSVGFLELRRITFEGSGGALLEKIARYEAVHPVGSLSELKARLGEGRRCFAFFHPCLPDEPLVFVHVALLPEVAGSMADIVNRGGCGDEEEGNGCEEDKVRTKSERASFFCSVAGGDWLGTAGLSGLVVRSAVLTHVPVKYRGCGGDLETFATLSPIPSFRSWLGKKAKHRAALGVDHSELSGEILLTAEEAVAILADVTANDNDGRPQDDVSNDKGGAAAALTTLDADARREAEALAVLLSDDGVPGAAAESALTRLAARYLVRETVRGKIPDPVGNFHV